VEKYTIQNEDRNGENGTKILEDMELEKVGHSDNGRPSTETYESKYVPTGNVAESPPNPYFENF
jgi:hypothetical protein